MTDVRDQHQLLKATPKLVSLSWAKRWVDRARSTHDAMIAKGGNINETSKSIDRTNMTQAERCLAAAAAHRGGPVTVHADPDDFGEASVTFSREQKIANAISCAASVIVYATSDPEDYRPGLITKLKGEMYDELKADVDASEA